MFTFDFTNTTEGIKSSTKVESISIVLPEHYFLATKYKKSVIQLLKQDFSLKENPEFQVFVIDPKGLQYTNVSKYVNSFDHLNETFDQFTHRILEILWFDKILNEYTLVYLDFPEAFLHSKHVVEYAHFVLQICKETKCKFLIQTTSFDFFNTIKLLSSQLNVTDINYYLLTVEEHIPQVINGYGPQLLKNSLYKSTDLLKSLYNS
jgi:hypothetical protein